MKRLNSTLSLALVFAVFFQCQMTTFAAVGDTGFSDVSADVTVLYRMEGSPEVTGASGFLDVARGAWYADSVTWAAQNGIVSGYDSGLFGINDPTPQPIPVPNKNVSEVSISITVGGSVFSAKLYDNDAAKALLAQFPMTLNMSELNGNEKYYYLPEKLPTASERIGSIRAGDLMLYGSDCLVLFYESFSGSYNYTRLGHIEDASGLANALGRGSVEVILRAD